MALTFAILGYLVLVGLLMLRFSFPPWLFDAISQPARDFLDPLAGGFITVAVAWMYPVLPLLDRPGGNLLVVPVYSFLIGTIFSLLRRGLMRHHRAAYVLNSVPRALASFVLAQSAVALALVFAIGSESWPALCLLALLEAVAFFFIGSAVEVFLAHRTGGVRRSIFRWLVNNRAALVLAVAGAAVGCIYITFLVPSAEPASHSQWLPSFKHGQLEGWLALLTKALSAPVMPAALALEAFLSKVGFIALPAALGLLALFGWTDFPPAAAQVGTQIVWVLAGFVVYLLIGKASTAAARAVWRNHHKTSAATCRRFRCVLTWLVSDRAALVFAVAGAIVGYFYIGLFLWGRESTWYSHWLLTFEYAPVGAWLAFLTKAAFAVVMPVAYVLEAALRDLGPPRLLFKWTTTIGLVAAAGLIYLVLGRAVVALLRRILADHETLRYRLLNDSLRMFVLFALFEFAMPPLYFYTLYTLEIPNVVILSLIGLLQCAAYFALGALIVSVLPRVPHTSRLCDGGR